MLLIVLRLLALITAASARQLPADPTEPAGDGDGGGGGGGEYGAQN